MSHGFLFNRAAETHGIQSRLITDNEGPHSVSMIALGEEPDLLFSPSFVFKASFDGPFGARLLSRTGTIYRGD